MIRGSLALRIFGRFRTGSWLQSGIKVSGDADENGLL